MGERWGERDTGTGERRGELGRQKCRRERGGTGTGGERGDTGKRRGGEGRGGQLKVQCLWFTVHDSQFTVHDSRITIHGSRLARRERGGGGGSEGKWEKDGERGTQAQGKEGESYGRQKCRRERGGTGTGGERGDTDKRRGGEGRGGQLKVQCLWFTVHDS